MAGSTKQLPGLTKLRILIACEFYYPSVGGVQEVIRQIAERLTERGHEVTVATSYLPEREARVRKGVRIKEFRVAGNLATGITGEADAYRDFVLAGAYDVFMVKAAQQWTFDALVPILDRMTKPKVFVPCGFSGLYEPVYDQYFRLMPELLRNFDHLIFYASDYRDVNLARACGIESYSIVPNGADEREFLVPADPLFRGRHGIARDALLILTVGSLTGAKGHREVAEAFVIAELGLRQTYLLMVGNRAAPAPWRNRIAHYVRTAERLWRMEGVLRVVRWALRPLLLRIGLRRLLKALGYKVEPTLEQLLSRVNRSSEAKRGAVRDLDRREVVQAYLNSDLFVFASNVEYSPLVLFEAAAAGLPFLSVPVGNATEIARWTGGGEICPAELDAQGYTRVDPRVLARHMQDLVSNPDRLEALGEAGRRNWQEKFTWGKIVDRYEAIFERLIAGT